MANFRRFVWEGLKKNDLMGVYLNRWPQIGSCRVEILENLHFKIFSQLTIHDHELVGYVEAIMPNEDYSGECNLILNGHRETKCPYKVDGSTLVINHSIAQIKIQNHDKKWTWININHQRFNSWFGLWPLNDEMDLENTIGLID